MDIASSTPNGQRIATLFQLIDKDKNGVISLPQVMKSLKKQGILEDDPRLQSFISDISQRTAGGKDQAELSLDEEFFSGCIEQHVVPQNALAKKLVIPDFEGFTAEIKKIFDRTRANKGGAVANYIPQLARVNPDQFAVSICTVDGQRLSLGDSRVNYCLQSTCKPINYCLAIEELGVEKVHQHVGREPSGRSFNELSLNEAGLPHNPMINSGAIMSASLIRRREDIADRYDYIRKTWSRLCADQSVGFNNAVFLSEKQTADRNFALAYFMRENKAFPEHTDLMKTLELYFQSCSIESCTHSLATAAATLANAGINPLTRQQIFQPKTVQHCMSLMLTCGMYDFSGEFAFKIGLPAKSGVSGAMLVIVPNVMGIAIWSPRLDKLGNSVRGVEFCERLVETYNFHHYDSLTRESKKKNPRLKKYESKVNQLVNLIWAASKGDLDEIKRLKAEGMDLSEADYDGRTALHLAASENRVEVVRYLLDNKVPLQVKDRWGGTPLVDAQKGGHHETVELIENFIQSDNQHSPSHGNQSSS